MSKADMLGESATFDAVAQPISSRAAAFARFNQSEPQEAAVPAAAAQIGRFPVAVLAHNPYNPREELKEVEDLADSLAARGVIQPLTVVSRSAFLSAHPEFEGTLAGAEYIVVDGNRRLAAANLAGLDDVPVHLDDSFAESADTLLETALIAAVQHEDLSPMDEAKALERLVEVHGSQRAVARALGKSSSWVTQRMALLKLTPELQQAVEEKTLPVDVARKVGQLPGEKQQAAADAARNERKQSKKNRAAYDVSASVPPARHPESQAADDDTGPRTRDRPQPPASGATAVPEEADAPALSESHWMRDIRKLPKVPWHDGNGVADLVFEKMDVEQRTVLLERLLAAHEG
ncbi:ParB/RepB/Spo0J family partition protein [Streptomyces sp. NRRL S-87]|uniref:ParB/RepB/Spo0J family partition protein n=1 Tax=Streptomyces sp. NRRL S-87 TaxID=1463920 RepID=UPI00068B90F0|nr:ParB/RepB/Spo0J family partition protein [Streptomyces sp. NRRL S-87]